jgi:hypothetical protein
MAFDGVFIDKSGKPFPKEIGDLLEECVTDFLATHSDADLSVVIDGRIAHNGVYPCRNG